jgi:hypothetical protein
MSEKLESNTPSDAATCSRSLEDQAVEYAEALNDIADTLQLPTGVTSAEIVAACQRTRNIAIEECAVAIQTQERGTRYQWMPDSHFGTMTQEMANRLRRVKSPENS